jgi:bacillithiol biosynthesis cysteine-adding enzyme BshC
LGRSFSSSYVAGDPRARPFLARDFRDAAARREATLAAAGRRPRPELLAVLAEQQAGLPASAARDANLAALAAGAATVVTGQQVGLFLGPLYSFYKAASAVAVARALEAESGARVVPLFWLQTEDHDFAEIASTTLAGHGDDGAPVSLALAPEPATRARVSVAHRRLGPEIVGLVDALAAALGPRPEAAEVVALVRAAYVPDRPLARAFAELLASLFAEEGLLVLDPRDARVASLAAPLYRRALDGAAALEDGLRARGAALAAEGWEEQIPVRPGCSLLFFHERDPAGPRYRLQRAGAGWRLANGASAPALDGAVADALARAPLRFSTSALLRPVVQDALLPTAAYVGGPAEVSYFAQLAPVYDALGVAQPLVVPRARFRVLDAPTRRRLAQLGLGPDEACGPRPELLGRLGAGTGAAGPDPEALRRAVAERVTPAARDVTSAAADANPRLARLATRTRATVDRALTRFVERYARARQERDLVVTARLDKVRRALAPDGVPQERAYGWPSLAARHGAAAFKALVLERLAKDPFPVALQDLEP